MTGGKRGCELAQVGGGQAGVDTPIVTKFFKQKQPEVAFTQPTLRNVWKLAAGCTFYKHQVTQ